MTEFELVAALLGATLLCLIVTLRAYVHMLDDGDGSPGCEERRTPDGSVESEHDAARNRRTANFILPWL